MKKIILVGIILLGLAMSCEKERCYSCEQTITATAPGIDPQVTKSSFTHCGDKREVEGTTTSSTTVNGITATAVSVVKCN